MGGDGRFANRPYGMGCKIGVNCGGGEVRGTPLREEVGWAEGVGLGGPGDEEGAHGFGAFQEKLAASFFQVVFYGGAQEAVFFAAFRQEEHSSSLLPRLVGGLEAVEFGGWQVFDVGGDAHFVQEFQELGSGGQGEPGFAVNVGP